MLFVFYSWRGVFYIGSLYSYDEVYPHPLADISPNFDSVNFIF